MGAIATRHKVERIAFSRIQRRMNRFPAGQRDGRGRKSVDPIGIVVSVGSQILASDTPLVFLSHPIDDRRIGLQPHTFLQAPDKDAGHFLPLMNRTGFALNDRRHNQSVIGRIVRQVFSLGLPFRRKHLFHSLKGPA